MMQRITGSLIGAGLVLLVLAVVATLPSPLVAQDSDRLVIARTSDIPTADPHKSGSFGAEQVFIDMYDTLIDRDLELRLKPGLALSWQSVGPTTWEFKLRRGVRFHNGEPFNAQAVKFSFERAIDPKTKWARAAELRLIKSVVAVDDYTVRITTERPWPFFLQVIARHGWMVPPQYLQKNGDDALARNPVGTGPYKFVRWVKDDRLELEANTSYWGGQPKIGRIVIRVIPSDSSRLGELLAGSVHLINLIPPELYGPIERSSRAKLVHGRSTAIYYVQFNLLNIPRNHPLADKRVRQALNLAVDRSVLITSIMQRVGTPVATICTELDLGCDSTIPPFAYDPTRAVSMLKDAGFPNGFEMTVVSPTGGYPGDRDLTLAIADQLNRAEIKAQPVIQEYGLFLRALIDRKIPQQAVFTRNTGHVGYAGEVAFTTFHSEGLTSFWQNKEFDKLLDDAFVTADEPARRDLLRRAQLLFKEEAPAIPLFTAPNSNGLHRDLEWSPRPDGLLKMFDAAWKRR